MNLYHYFSRNIYLLVFVFIGFLFSYCQDSRPFDELEEVGLPKEELLPSLSTPSTFDCTGSTPVEACESLKNLYLANQETFEKNKQFHNWFQLEKNLCFWKGITCDEHKDISILSIRSNEMGVKLTTLPTSSFAGITKVKQISLLNHDISEIHANTFKGLLSLRVLILSYNQIEKIEANAFSGPIYLENLVLINNEIKEISQEKFADLGKLKTLQLSHNQIKKIKGYTFMSLYNLKELDLADNPIETAEPMSFSGLENLERLEFNGNLMYGNVSRDIFYGCTKTDCRAYLSKLTSIHINENMMLPKEMCKNESLRILPNSNACYD